MSFFMPSELAALSCRRPRWDDGSSQRAATGTGGQRVRMRLHDGTGLPKNAVLVRGLPRFYLQEPGGGVGGPSRDLACPTVPFLSSCHKLNIVALQP